MKKTLLFIVFILIASINYAQSWGIVGSAAPNGWNGPDLEMTYNVDLDVWEATVEFTDGEIKFRADNNWDNNYGDDGNDGSLEPGGANILVSAGYYRVSLNLTTLTYILEPFEFLLGGTWKVAPEPGSLKVGPTEGSDTWWSIDALAITDRVCFFDNEYVFSIDGFFNNVLGNETWIEYWQGTEECGVPIAPFDGTVTATYNYDETAETITLDGLGAFLGLPVEVDGAGVPIPESVSYKVSFLENNNVMMLSLETANGAFWTFKMINDRVVSIPDENFEQALLDLGLDTDGVLNGLISKMDAENVTELNVNGKNIASLQGLESFINLENLECRNNLLQNLDVSNIMALKILECENNQISELDLSLNSNLEVIGCANNNLSVLDVSQNLALKAIWCATNNISKLNLEVNTNLNVYGLFDNPLTSLSIKNGNNHNIVYSDMSTLSSLPCITVDDYSADNSNLNLDPNVLISNNCSGIVYIPDPIFEQALIDLSFDTDNTVNGEISQVDAENIYSLDIVGLGINDLSGIEYFMNLEQLFCNNNNLTELQLNTHPNLNGIWMNNNPVTSINLKNCPSLVYLHISQNQLVNIDISNNPLLMELSIANNNLTSLDASNNPNLTFLRANGNDLYSINIENGNNLNFVAPNWWAYSFDVRFNNNLTCIQVDAGVANNIPEDWAKPNSTFYSENGCNDLIPIPDAAFEQALINLGIDSNGNSGDVLKRDIHLITNLDLNNKGISSLQGLEAFVNLTYLNVWGNPIGSLNISMFPELETLWCGSNGLSNLDLSQNTKLKNLYAWTNQLTSLNTSNNPLLEDLQLGENQLTGLDLSNNTLLTNVEIHKNAFTSIDLSANILLTQFWAWENQLTGLDLSKNGALNHIRIQDNLELSYLNVKNGNNENIDNFYVSNTPKLSCITSDAVVSDVMTTYAEGRLSEDCGAVYIPDENFEQTLIDIGIDSDGEVNSLVTKTDVEAVSSLNLTNPLFDPNSGFANPLIINVTEKIKDLTGIEAFVNVTNLQLGYGELSKIDISNNTLLEELFLNDNELSTIDVSNNTLLKRLGVMRNPDIATLDVSNNLLLEELFIDNTAITSMDVSKNENLWKFYARWGILTGIDLSNNTNLIDVRLRGSDNLIYANLRNGNNINIIGFDVRDMSSLGCITTDDVQSQLMIDFSQGKTFSADCGNVYIPDENFEQALLDIGVDTDGVLNHLMSKTDAEAVIELNVSNPLFTSDGRYDNDLIVNVTEKIADLTGIQAFINITKLSCWGGEITSLDLSNNPLLETIELVDNQISNINLSQNTEVTVLWLETNALTEVDISNNTKVENIALGYNELTSIDFTNNALLWAITAEGNNLENVDVSKNSNLTSLWLFDNQNLKTVILPESSLLARLGMWNTAIRGLDLSTSPIERLYVHNNPELSYLNMKNENNINVTHFYVSNTPKLNCISSDEAVSEVMTTYAEGRLSEDCGMVSIPDENFEQALIDLGIDSDGLVNHLISKYDAESATEIIANFPIIQDSNGNDIDNPFADSRVTITEKIKSLEGIEAFVNLTKLGVGYGELTTVDLSKNTKLDDLFLNDNLLTSIDISHNTLLTRFGVMRNPILGSIDVSTNTLLEELFLSETGISSIDLSNNTKLLRLFINNNNLISLDISSNISLDRLDAQDNGGLVLETDTNLGSPTLRSLNLSNTGLNSFNAMPFPNLEWLLLNDNTLTNFDTSTIPNIKNLYIQRNQLQVLDVSSNMALEKLECESNELLELDVSQNVNLKVLGCSNNNLAALDLSKNLVLEAIWCPSNNISSLNLDKNVTLKVIGLAFNPLTSLSIRNGNSENVDWAQINQLPDLSCINVDDPNAEHFSSWKWLFDPTVTLSQDCGDFVNIPDPNFEQALIDLGIDSDGVVNASILREDAEAVIDTLNLSNPLFDTSGFENPLILNVTEKIADLTGIEAFINITSLTVGYNALETINVSENVKLEELFVNDNLLTGIDISNNTLLKRFGIMRNNISGTVNVGSNNLLEELFIHETGIGSIDLIGNPNLTKLFINDNNLISLVVSLNTSLTEIRCQNNQITALDVSTNLTLERVDAQYNTGLNVTFPAVELLSLTSLNLSGTGINRFNATLLPSLEWLLLNDNALTNFNASKVPNIQHLRINNNQLGSLDVSGNSALVDLQIANNELTDLNVANGFNLNLAAMNATSNLLTCITADSEDMALAPYANWGLDLGVLLSLNCKTAPEVVIIPDENFETALGSFDTNGPNGNILLSDALLIAALDISSSSISDLTGIEAFENLVSLNVSDNNLNELNVTFNDQLEFLDCSGNNLSSIDLSQNGKLISLNVANNNLQELTISATKSLTELDCSNNSISSINLAELTSLTSLDISSNLMTTIDVTGLDQLTYLDVSSNMLSELDVRNGANNNLGYFDARENTNLTCIGVDDTQLAEDALIAEIWLKDGSAFYTTSGDCLPPNVITQNVAIGIDAKGVANVSAAEIDFGSSDNSTPSKNLTFELTRTDTSGPAEFTCEDVGKEIQVMLSVTDLEGNSDFGFANVTVEDLIPPVAKSVRSLSFDLADGTVNIGVDDIEDGSTDNCGLPSLSLGDTGGSFVLPGSYVVILTATDTFGNSSSSETEVEIVDSSISTSGLSFGKLKLTVFPVPFSDVINISFSEPTDLTTVNVSLLYFDQTDTGIRFYENGANLISDNTTGLSQPSTIYWLQVTIHGKKTQTQTIQIIKGDTN